MTPRPRPHAVRTALLVCVVLLASGCVAGPPLGQTQSPTTDDTEGPNCVESVSFWGLAGSSTDHGWEPDTVRIGYTLPPNTGAFFVAYSDDSVVGVASAANGDAKYAVASDGDRIELDAPLNGRHTIRVVAVADTNRNGEFDPGADAPCRRNGDAVEAGPRAIDFSRFAVNETDAR